MRHPTLITPRDFDLSPYFDIVKLNQISRGDFDYRRIHWADDDVAAARETAPSPSAKVGS